MASSVHPGIEESLGGNFLHRGGQKMIFDSQGSMTLVFFRGPFGGQKMALMCQLFWLWPKKRHNFQATQDSNHEAASSAPATPAGRAVGHARPGPGWSGSSWPAGPPESPQGQLEEGCLGERTPNSHATGANHKAGHVMTPMLPPMLEIHRRKVKIITSGSFTKEKITFFFLL